MSTIEIKIAEQVIEVDLIGGQGPAGPASGPLGAGSVEAVHISNDAGEQNAIADKIGALRADNNFQTDFDVSNPENWGWQLNSVASGKQVDGIYIYSEFVSAGSGYPFHGVAYSDATVGPDAAGGVGGAIGGPGPGSGVVGNRQESGAGNGLQGARLGSGQGAGVEARASSTGECYAIRGIKQNPSGGVAGAGPAVLAINDATNGEAIYGRSGSANANENTAVFDRLNGTAGTAFFARVTGGGARTGLLRVGASHHVPTAASTGAASVIGHDFQINSNVTGSNDTRAINIANASTGGAEAFGAIAVVDGVNVTNYGFFLNAANATTNHALYCAGSGLASFGGAIRFLNDGTQDIGTGSARAGTIYAATGTINTSDAREKKWLGELTPAHLRAARRIGQSMGLYQWLDQVRAKGEKKARIHFGPKAQDVIEIFYEEGLEKRPSKGKRPNFRHAFLCYDEWDDILEPVMEKHIEVEDYIDWIETGEKVLITPSPIIIKQKDGSEKIFVPEPYEEPRLVAVKSKRDVERWVETGKRVSIKAGNRYGLRPDELIMFMVAAQEARLAKLEAV